MKKLHFSVVIDAPTEKVWHTMLDEATYGEWTQAFNEGSRYEGSWEKGSKILFIGPDPNTGDEGGMVARIAENKPYEFVSIEHVGLMQNGVEDVTSEEAQKWVPAFENYTFKETDSGTELSVDVDVNEEYLELFKDMWPDALARLKDIAETA